jgi:phage-related protein
MAEKPVVWLGSALDDLRAFPEEARRSAGHPSRSDGLGAQRWKPVPTIGSGVMELRIHSQSEHRVFYIAKFAEAVFVIHAFQKKTQKTPKRDIDLAKHRLAELLQQRSKH